MQSLGSRKEEEQALKRAHNRHVAAYLRGIILSRLKKEQLSGYGLLVKLNKELNLCVGPGTLYSNLYALERLGLVKISASGRKRVCMLTPKGETIIDSVQESKSLRHTLFLISQEVFSNLE
jgi:DNA-binding PadR family transcriptional regulator